MRFFQIAVFLFIFNLMGGILGQAGVFVGAGFNPTDQADQQKESIRGAYEQTNTADEQTGLLGDLNYLVENVRLVLSAVGIFVDVFANTVLVKPTLTNILCSGQECGPLLEDFINILTAVTLLTYVVGLLQFLSGRNMEAMQ